MPEAMGGTAQALEATVHIPFRRRIKECQFFADSDIPERNKFKTCRVKETIGVTTVVCAFEVFGEQLDVDSLTNLNGQVVGRIMRCLRTEGSDHVINAE
jgi:hypothetical protein